MRVVSCKCPNCGADVDPNDFSKYQVCPFCKSKLVIDVKLVSPNTSMNEIVKIANHFFMVRITRVHIINMLKLMILILMIK